MTPPKRWPKNAEWARLDCIALAREIDGLALPVFEGQRMTEIEKVQRAGRICRLSQEIIYKLEAARPDRTLTIMP